MTRTFVWWSIMAGLLLTTVSCKTNSSDSAEALTLQTVSLSSNATMNDDTAGLSLELTLALTYPVDYTDPLILEKVRHQVVVDYFPEGADTVFSSPETLLAAYVEDYKRFFFESQATYADMTAEADFSEEDAWYNDQKLLIRYNEGGLFSYTVATDRYSGGAHGEKKYINRVFNLKTGLKVTEDDLFTEEAQPLIVEMIQRKLMERHDLNSVEALEEIGFFDVSEMGLNTNFYLSKEGLTYTFNEYEIASYAVGATDVTLSFNSLAGFLKTGHPLTAFIQ